VEQLAGRRGVETWFSDRLIPRYFFYQKLKKPLSIPSVETDGNINHYPLIINHYPFNPQYYETKTFTYSML
jgi:hypothetical protein